MGELLSCPFCRELFSQDEGPQCPECDLPLVPLRQLPLSAEGQAEAALENTDPPEDQRLPFLFFRRGRGTLTATAAVGLALFLQPWISLGRPDEITMSGFDLATSNAPWLWGGAVGWFLTIPLVLSRRTVNELRGVRVIATLFAALTLGEVGMLLTLPPQTNEYFSVELEYVWGIYASGLIAALGVFFAIHLGGTMDDLRDLPVEIPSAQRRQTGEAIH